ncbi:large ribosomal subunit protein eL24-like [Dysidea avara]|uniref:large ribosomal subunit protein eL24-like n=1 Tax=Dysidea avara TaxID=196820 RepID=UPI00331808F2
MVKTELCQFSGYRIAPGHGKRFVRIDGKVLTFLNGKTEASYKMKRNPRNTSWTVLYRRKHKKGTTEESVKRRTRRTVKFDRGIQGATLEQILQKRNQTQDVRKAQREQLIRAAKDKNKQKEASKKALKQKAVPQKAKVAQKMKAQAPRVGGKR